MRKLDPRSVVIFSIWWLIVGWFFVGGGGVWLGRVLDEAFEKTIYQTFWLQSALPFFIPIWFFAAIGWGYATYRLFGYKLTQEGVVQESGVILRQHTTIPFDRIQNVDVYRGPLLQILGLAELRIQTAGSGSGGSEGKLPGLSRGDAEKLRDEIISIVTRTRESGYGKVASRG